jgi:nicotinamidase/pyrazinamidase
MDIPAPHGNSRAANQTLGRSDAHIIVGVQRDSLPGGALGVAQCESTIPMLNRCIDVFRQQGLPIFATRDWHPADHCSFRAAGGPWPPHCIAGTTGAEFAADLRLPPETRVISKATSSDTEAYSSFRGTDLGAELRASGCKRVLIGGLATDYCVRAVDAQRGDGERVLAELRARGVELRCAAEICRPEPIA